MTELHAVVRTVNQRLNRFLQYNIINLTPWFPNETAVETLLWIEANDISQMISYLQMASAKVGCMVTVTTQPDDAMNVHVEFFSHSVALCKMFLSQTYRV